MQKIILLFLLVSCASYETPINNIIPSQDHKSFYQNNSTMNWVAEVIDLADCVTTQERLHTEIVQNGPYEHYTGSNEKIVEDLKSDKQAKVGTYHKRFTKARAYRNPNTNKIWLNRAKLGTVNAGLVNTMIHERLHVLGYGHKGNKKNKYNNVESVPYKVGRLSEKYFKECFTRKAQ